MREHAAVLDALGAEVSLVRRVDDLEGLWGIVLPGGESTTIGMLMTEYGLRAPLATGALPVLGTCAGLILMARRLEGGEAPWLGLLDVTVLRNAYGRQGESHETDLDVTGIGVVRGVFIRAPYISEVGEGVEILGRDGAGHPVVVRQGRHLGLAFHPELAAEGRVHAAFLKGLAGPVESLALGQRP